MNEQLHQLLSQIADLERTHGRRQHLLEELERHSIIYQKALAQAGAALYHLDWQAKKYTFLGSHLYDFVGYRPHELNYEKLQALILERHFLGALQGKSPAEIDRLFEQGALHEVQCEYKVRTAYGTEKWVADDSVEIYDDQGVYVESIGMLQDITERKQAELNLKETLSLLSATLEATADGILVVDSAGKVVRTNARFAEMWRIPSDLLASQDDARLIAFVCDQLVDPESFMRKVRELYADPEAHSVDSLGFKDGRVYERLSHPQKVDGETVGRVWSFHDVSERVHAESERFQLEAQILHAQKLESLGVLAGGIAHEFNNLLTGMLGNADLALMSLSSVSPARHNLEQIEKIARRAAELTKQMLAYSGRGRFVVQTLWLSDVVRDMAHLLEVSISKKCVLKYHFEKNVPPIEGDPSQLRQVVINLISNASEAIGEQSGVISVSTGVMTCNQPYLAGCYVNESLPEGSYSFLEVADSGCGISKDTRARLFDPFFSTKFTGRGLGLAAVLGIMRGHRGTIRVSSEEGRGATFRVLFPAAMPGAASAETPEPNRSAWYSSGMILIIDDAESIRELGKAILERSGFSVLTASDGEEGVAVFREHADAVRMVLLDMTMPRMNGEEALEVLRKIRPNVPVVVTSGYSEQETQRRFADKALAGFIEKPFGAEDLTAIVRRVLEA